MTRHPLRALRRPSGGDASRRARPRAGEREPDGSGHALLGRRADEPRRAPRGDGTRRLPADREQLTQPVRRLYLMWALTFARIAVVFCLALAGRGTRAWRGAAGTGRETRDRPSLLGASARRERLKASRARCECPFRRSSTAPKWLCRPGFRSMKLNEASQRPGDPPRSQRSGELGCEDQLPRSQRSSRRGPGNWNAYSGSRAITATTRATYRGFGAVLGSSQLASPERRGRCERQPRSVGHTSCSTWTEHDVDARTDELERRYGFTRRHRYPRAGRLRRGVDEGLSWAGLPPSRTSR